MGLIFFDHIDVTKLFLDEKISLYLLIVLYAIVGPIYILITIFEWFIHSNWSIHPIAQNLAAYSNNNTSWMTVASDINIEYRRFIFKLTCNVTCFVFNNVNAVLLQSR